MATANKKIVWLASWYPNPANPFDGDFVQRHARAVAMHTPLTVFYVAQYGITGEESANTDRVIVNEGNNLIEKIFFFRFKKTGVNILDKILYNRTYFKTYKKALKDFIKINGLPSIVHVHVPVKAGLLALWIKKKYGIPYIITEHSTAYDETTPDSFHKRGWLHKSTTRLLFKRATLVTTVSEALAKQLLKYFSIKHTIVINNVADTQLFTLDQNIQGGFTFIHASTMGHQKNVEGIIRTLARLKQLRTDWSFKMLGWDSIHLRKLAIDLGLDNFITWWGPVSYEEVAREMRQSSSLVLFSRYENFPCVIAEALCCGLPVIATKVGGIAEAVNDNNGILVDSENEDQLLDAMLKMLSDYKEFNREQIALSASERFNYAAIGNEFISVYKQIPPYSNSI